MIFNTSCFNKVTCCYRTSSVFFKFYKNEWYIKTVLNYRELIEFITETVLNGLPYYKDDVGIEIKTIRDSNYLYEVFLFTDDLVYSPHSFTIDFLEMRILFTAVNIDIEIEINQLIQLIEKEIVKCIYRLRINNEI